MSPYRKFWMRDQGALLKTGIFVSSLLATVWGTAGPAQALTVKVDCTLGKTIANSLTKSPGKPLTVEVEGTCNENVVVSRNDVTLVADVSGGTVNGVNPSEHTITVNADRVTIDGLEVTGGRNGISAEGAGKLTIKNCNVHNAVRHGIVILGGSKVAIDNCTVQSNGVFGIAIGGGAAATVINSAISSNTRDGIFISTGGYGQIGVNDRFDAAPGNTISNNGANGIFVSTGGTALIVANTISGNGTDPAQGGRSGISVFMASAQIIGGNNITGHPSHGIGVNSANVSIGGSTVGTVVGLPVVTISGNGVTVANSSGVSGFNGASIQITQTTISGTLNGGRGITLSLLSRLSTFGGNVQVINNAGDGIGVFTGSAANFGTPAASVTGNTGFGLNCSGPESSFAGDTSGITGNTAGNVNPVCTGF